MKGITPEGDEDNVAREFNFLMSGSDFNWVRNIGVSETFELVPLIFLFIHPEMDSNADSQGDGSSFQEQSYYEGMDDTLQDDSEYQGGDVEQRSPLREQDRFLPIANISKIMKRSLPSNGKIAKDAKECVQECVSEFISFITSEAAERCQNEKRKTINGEDILCAMNHLGFDNYVEPLKAFLVKFRELSKLESGAVEEATIQQSHVQQVAQPAQIITQANNVTTLLVSPALMSAAAAAAAGISNGAPTTTIVTRSAAAAAAAASNASIINGGILDADGHPQQITLGEDIKIQPATINAPAGATIIVPISTQQIAIVQSAAVAQSGLDSSAVVSQRC
ncbi:unnamed protein product [Protopolystoma xenopodis]|uniref:Transcription factor CBF/NF-Y/archaeal histone domain-containing protein n=1 Tax=Protopolystoma xenopodis TaxID=117903 RepID=A0A3S4ZMZ1_9PLAT|nr:unnamed protein product [Protopolystoma xenopodis]